MKKLAIIVFIFVSLPAFGQLDSLGLNLPQDTLTTLTGKLDSIQASVYSKVDSATQSYREITSKVQRLTSRYQYKIDSLTNLNLPTEMYTKKIDSLNTIVAQTKQKVEAKIDAIKQKATEKINSLPLPPELQSKITQVTSSLDKPPGINSPVDLKDLDASLDKLEQNSALKGVTDLTSMDGINVPENLAENLKGVSDVTNGVTDHVGSIQQQAGDVMSNANQLDKLAENQVNQLEVVKAIQDATGDLPTAMPSEEEAKRQVMDIQTLAVDHFAGKQEVLRAAMDKVAKCKEKYESAPSIGDLPKPVSNAMHGKPFIERLVPAVGLQFQVSRNWMMDTYISAGYRVSGKITAGIGWNQRVAYNFDNGKFNEQAKIYGVRNYGEFRFKKGFIARGEVEWMNASIPPMTQTATEVGQREWVFGIYTGMKKEYRFLRTVKGNVQVMYNIWDPHNKSPYVDRLNVRMGFEFALKKKMRTK